MKKKQQEQNLMSAYDFAELKGVTNTIIYRAIGKGIIQVVKVGKHKYIDANQYTDLVFPKINYNKKLNKQHEKDNI